MIFKENVMGYEFDKSVNIYRAKNLYIEMKSNVEKYRTLERLTFEDYINTIKNSVNYSDFIGIEYAQEYLSMIENGKITKRKKCEEIFMYEKLQETIKELITGCDIKILRISRFGLNTDAWIIEFECKSKIFEIYIPVLRNLNSSNFEICHEGKLALGVQVDEINWDMFAISYKEEEIKEIFIKYMEKHTKGVHLRRQLK